MGSRSGQMNRIKFFKSSLSTSITGVSKLGAFTVVSRFITVVSRDFFFIQRVKGALQWSTGTALDLPVDCGYESVSALSAPLGRRLAVLLPNSRDERRRTRSVEQDERVEMQMQMMYNRETRTRRSPRWEV